METNNKVETSKVETIGMLSQEDLKYYKLDYPRREMCKTFKLKLPEDFSENDILLQFFFNANVIENGIIYTQGKNKSFIHCIINIKIIYESKEFKDIKTMNFNEHFSCLLPMNNSYNTDVFIEDAIIVKDNDTVYTSLLLLIAPVRITKIKENKKLEFTPKVKIVNKIKDIKEQTINSDLEIEDDSESNIEIEYDMGKQ